MTKKSAQPRFSRQTVVITIATVLVTGVLFGFWWVRSYLSLGKAQILPGVPIEVTSLSSQPASVAAEQVKYQIEPVVQNVRVPWSIVFTSPNRMLVSERVGTIRAVVDGTLVNKPLGHIEVSNQSEEGLMGLVLDPNYDKNKFFYACYAYDYKGTLYDQVVRLEDKGESFATIGTVIDKIPAAKFHAGCELSFGPDGKLYISTGDATDKQSAQDPQSLAGKILRLNSNGTIPTDNPIPGSPIFSLGHRNPQGLAWHPITGQLWSTEHGPSGNDGPGGGDEINAILPGGNFGWPKVSHDRSLPGLLSPLVHFTPAVAPGSAHFYQGDMFPEWRNHLIFAALKGEGLFRVEVSQATPAAVIRYEKLPGIEVGRIREITEGPDGAIYFATSNTDGRGRSRSGDDMIYRLIRVK